VTAYYNEIDPRAAAWLRELIRGGRVAPGDVDERSIVDVRPDDLVGYDQCHFFAGIGGWSYALRLAGWPDDRPVWTGSCPCQPFSTAGKGRGVDDERHLWPELRRLITERRPAVCFGEQVAGAAGLAWLAAVRADLEGLAYAVGAADLCAAGVGAPHIRQRIYWVADAACERRDGKHALLRGYQGGRDARPVPQAPGRRKAGRLDAWRDHGWVRCTDGLQRPVAPIARIVDDGVPERVGLLRGYGNAIVPQVAAEFIGAWLDLTGPT